MNHTKTLMLSLLFLTPAVAMAEQVTCESRDNKQVECPMNTSGVVSVVRQLSNTRCVEGQNWGLFKHSVWVKDGCRAVFSSAGQAASQQSAYGGGNNYGGNNYGGNDSSSPSKVTCESKDGRRAECNMNTRGRVRVVQQLSKTACIEDQNWGLNKSSIWVSGGCRAVFALEGANNSQPSRSDIAREDAQYDSNARAPAAAIRGCNQFANEGYDGTILSQNALKPGFWEIVLRFEQYRYACNVSDRGEVSEFNKLD
jgi:hypothetical protein